MLVILGFGVNNERLDFAFKPNALGRIASALSPTACVDRGLRRCGFACCIWIAVVSASARIAAAGYRATAG
jgi:hypothetical protein